MKVKVIKEFFDRTDDLKLRVKDDELEVTEERANHLKALGLVEDLPEQEEPKQEAAKEPPKPRKKKTE